MKSFSAILLFIMLFFSGFASSQVNQNDTNTYVIKKSNGAEYIGKIISDDGREVLIATKELGNIYIPKADIISIKVVDIEKEMVNNEYRGKGVFTTRYQFSTNAFPIEKDENYAMINLYGPEVHFALNKRISIGLMASWIASPLVLAVKYTIPTSNEKINFGFGTLLGTTGYLNQAKGFGGLHWGMVTLGDRAKNVTLSLGYSYFKPGLSRYDTFYQPGTYSVNQQSYYSNIIEQVNSPLVLAPVFGVASIAPVGKKASFILDAMFILGKTSGEQEQDITSYNDTQGQPIYYVVSELRSVTSPRINFVFMPGMRFQKSETKAFQISLAGIIGYADDLYSFPVPMCSWFYKF
jgi:hypothetical protein